MPDNTSQVGKFLSTANAEIGQPAAPEVAQDLPKVPFQTALKLTVVEEKRLLDHAFSRYRTLNNELGRDQTLSPTWWGSGVPSSGQNTDGLMTAGATFLGKRSRFDAMFMNDVSWRPWTMPQPNIFMFSNLAVPLVRRVCRQMIARAKNAFFGSDPWFSTSPAPVVEHDAQNDADRADKIQAFSRFKLDEGHAKNDLGSAIKRALVLGECPVKTSYVVRDQMFNVDARVLHSVEGQPVLDANGNTITEADAFVDAEDGTGRRVLARDGQTEESLAPIWQVVSLDKRQVLFEGTKAEPIYYKDFLCPLTAKDEQSADCIIHLYDKPVMEFVDLVMKRGMMTDTMEASRRMLALVKDLSNNSPAPKSAETQSRRPNENAGVAPSVETGGPVAEFAEFYLWFDVFGDGVMRNIMLIADRNTQAPIFYDHVANVTTDGLRPIKIVRINPIEGRWYGQGIMELFESYQTAVDLLINRWNFSQSSSGRVDLWTPTNTLEGERDPNLKLNWGGSYTKKPGMKKEDVLESVYLTDVKFEQIYKQAEYFQQLLMNESGVANANDAQAAGLETSKLATGINNIADAGDELFKPVIADLKEGLDVILERMVEITLANINPVEAFTYLEGDTQGIDQITPEEVRGLKYKAKIELTKLKDQEQIQVMAAAAALIEKFYMLSPNVQAKVVEFYRKQVRALDPSCDVKTVLVPDQPAPPAQEPTKTAVSVSIKGENLTPEERAQLFTEKLGVEETAAEAAKAPKPEAKKEGNGSMEKLGSFAPNTRFQAQLTQKNRGTDS